MTMPRTCCNRDGGRPPRLAKALLCYVGALGLVLVLLAPLQPAQCLPAAAAPMPPPHARQGRHNRRQQVPVVQQQQQPNPQNPLALPQDDLAFGGKEPYASPSSSGRNRASDSTMTTLSMALYPKQFFAGAPTQIELPLSSEPASPSPPGNSHDAVHSACITLTDPLHVVHSAKLIGATHSAKLYPQPGCMSDDAGFILNPKTGRPVKADGVALSLAAPGHYLKLRKGRGFSGPVRSVRLCSEKEKEKCH